MTVDADNSHTTPIGSDTVGSGGDSSVATLSVPLPSGLIRSAAVTLSSYDNGTGIDNITFETIPEPSCLVLLCVGAAGFGWHGRRRRVVQPKSRYSALIVAGFLS